jgi:hypothetical protein
VPVAEPAGTRKLQLPTREAKTVTPPLTFRLPPADTTVSDALPRKYCVDTTPTHAVPPDDIISELPPLIVVLVTVPPEETTSVPPLLIIALVAAPPLTISRKQSGSII